MITLHEDHSDIHTGYYFSDSEDKDRQTETFAFREFIKILRLFEEFNIQYDSSLTNVNWLEYI